MSIRHFFDSTAVIKRMTPINGTDKVRSRSTATVDVNIQQLDRDTIEKMNGVFGEDYVLYCDFEVNIREGDTVEAGDNQYKVTEVIKATLFGINQFKQVYITKLDES